jgi:hypothetical protein
LRIVARVGDSVAMSERDPDHELRVAAVRRAVELMDAYDALVPVARLGEVPGLVQSSAKVG